MSKQTKQVADDKKRLLKAKVKHNKEMAKQFGRKKVK